MTLWFDKYNGQWTRIPLPPIVEDVHYLPSRYRGLYVEGWAPTTACDKVLTFISWFVSKEYWSYYLTTDVHFFITTTN